jgi:hypothetical protein
MAGRNMNEDNKPSAARQQCHKFVTVEQWEERRLVTDERNVRQLKCGEWIKL